MQNNFYLYNYLKKLIDLQIDKIYNCKSYLYKQANKRHIN